MSAIRLPPPDLQIAFVDKLALIKPLHLMEALLSTVGTLPTADIDRELASMGHAESLQRMAGWGLRGEVAFATGVVLAANPRLLGYYRLLLGYSQKEFFGGSTGLGKFKRMEEQGVLTDKNRQQLPRVIEVLCGAAAKLVNVVPVLDARMAHDLTLLTLGAQLRGSRLNEYGSKATRDVFTLIRSFVATAIVDESETMIRLKNDSNRSVVIAFSSDPDITVREEVSDKQFLNRVAIEIKGGRDVSNIHNRIGEAEKSHQKAKNQGFVECWTIVGVNMLDEAKAREESPTTNQFFKLGAILGRHTTEHVGFRDALFSRLGIREQKRRRKK